MLSDLIAMAAVLMFAPALFTSEKAAAISWLKTTVKARMLARRF